MQYRVRENGAILTQGEIRKLYANVSFPAVWDQAVCEEIGIDPILQSPNPTTTRFQSAFQNGVEQDTLGNWIHKWTVIDFGQDAIEAATVAQAAGVRSARSKKLAESDWTQMNDSPLSNVQKLLWADYRQALRDLSSTSGFPFDIQWPQTPNND